MSKPRRIIVYGFLTLLGAFPLVCLWAFMDVGEWLVVEDSLEPAHAIVVLGGHSPFHAMEAARLHGRGLAPVVWLTHGARPAEEAAFQKLGIRMITEQEYNRQVLERMGVPAASIRLLSDPVRNTEEELRLIARELKRSGGERVILITSKPHTRRVKATWRAVAGQGLRAEVSSPADEPYDSRHWWRNTEDAMAVSHEILGLMNVWAGFPVRVEGR